ncbi:MAG TPA: hypothetical protein VN757_08655 [Steroidobacteraceae bacterium]|nr:hypothetical protein [Steroidobacteraceae bacterium]
MTTSRENRTTTSARLSSFGLEDGPMIEAVLQQRSPPPETLHVLSTMDEVRTATETVAASGQRLISIMTPDLEPEIYDQAAFLEIIKRFVLGRSFAKVRVLLRDQARMGNGANRFIAMAHRLTSYLEIRLRAPQYRELTAAYCIADDRAIVYRLRADRAEGIAGFDNPPIARQYLQEFDAIWQASAPEEREIRIARR